MRYILASQSPRRRELLARTGLSFEVIPSSVDEKITKTQPSEIVLELSQQKATDVYQNLSETKNCVVIGSDTIVAYHDEILGKPQDKEEAYDMLSMLADRTHQVYTGVTLLINEKGILTTKSFVEKTDVTFYPIAKEDLRNYVESGDCLDKAGGYGIQGDFSIHVKEIHGDYNNVVGLPIGRLYQELLNIIYPQNEW